MLQKVEITHAGGATLLVGEQIERDEFDEANAVARADGLDEAKGQPVLLESQRHHCRHAHSFLPHHSRKPLAC